MSNGEAATPSHCPYCALQRGMGLAPEPGGGTGSLDVVARDFPTNAGALCRKGWSAAALLDHPDRLRAPLLRDRSGAPLRQVSWEEALERVAGGVRRIQERHGPDAVAVFGGGGLTNEKAYLLGKFARVALRTWSSAGRGSTT